MRKGAMLSSKLRHASASAQKRSVKHKVGIRAAKSAIKPVVYTFPISFYPDPRDRRLKPPSAEYVQNTMERLPVTVAGVTLVGSRSKILARVSRAPTGMLQEISDAVERVLRRNASANNAGRQLKSNDATCEHRCRNGKASLPALPPGLSWPKKKYSREHRAHGVTIEAFLRKEWQDLINAGFGELRWLRTIDLSAVNAIAYYERPDPKTGKRKRLPASLRFLTEKEITDRRLSGGLRAAMKSDPRLAGVVASRLRRGVVVPSL